MKVYRVGAIGCGAVWDRHKLAFKSSSRIECAWVYDPVRERAEAAAQFTGARVARSAEELCEAGEVDIVSILTPAKTHADLVELSAKEGKHLMLEKPMADTISDARRIVKAIQRAGVKCFHPTLRALGSDLFSRLKELTLEGGKLGPVRCGFMTFVGFPFQWASWFEDRTKCFPPAEWASHVFDTFMALTNAQPASVKAFSGRYFRDFDQDDVMTLAVEFKQGHYFQMTIAWTMKPEWGYHKQDFQLVCDRGVILHNWWSAEWRTSESRGEYASTRVHTGGDRWGHYHALIDAIEKGTPVSPDEQDGYEYVRIVDASAKSMRTGRKVRVSA